MGPFPPEAIGGYKYVSKITDEYTEWTAVYLLTNKNQALQSLRLFVGSTVIPFGGHIVRWRADKGGEYTGWEFRQYCLETGIIQEFAATNTPQQIDVSEREGRTLCNMVRCILADSGFPSMWGEPFMAAAYLKNKTLHKAFMMETPFKMLHGEEADLSHVRVIGAKTFVHIKDSRKLDAAAWERKVCGSEERKSCRVWNPETHRVVESRNVTFIGKPPHLLLPPSNLSPLQYDEDTMDSDYISYDDQLWDVRDTTLVFWTSPPTLPLPTRTPVACRTIRKCMR